ncbi:CoA-binding protein [Echinicola vietnamensis]|uniref:Putative CoA-binding protein n=1 Tax=Echinicola vietnamensis (strain DSM 17526 / LMG 23754 / KMM 6221) TaxID=926556 RepID=L0G2K5_ECHVK|nr:CoA-binding protein [Echinicola vietnamensis]AGA79231.1 putative CoA-binding protein [Echinicola vietnamensis DSM 17526]
MGNKTLKKTVIIGATSNPQKYAFLAAEMLQEHGQPFVPLSIHGGEVLGENILDLKEKPAVPDVHTVTLYINSSHQPEWENYLISLQPKRVIFNPGAENQSFKERLEAEGIEAVEACTLVMLRTGQF